DRRLRKRQGQSPPPRRALRHLQRMERPPRGADGGGTGLRRAAGGYFFPPIRGSVPAFSRSMFGRWRQKTSVASVTIRITMLPWPRSAAQMNAVAEATSAESDEIRLTSAVASHVAQAASPTGKASARSVPRKVATPLPPLNFS